MHSPSITRLFALLALLAPLALVGCGEDLTQPEVFEEGRLALISGDGQEGLAGQPTDQPYVVQALNQRDVALQGVTVRFEVESGAGDVQTVQTTTGQDGRAETVAVLPGAIGASQTVVASSPSLPGQNARFTSTVVANADGVAAVEAVSGSGQAGVPGQELPDPFIVRAVSPEGDPVPEATLRWSVLGGGGSVAAAQSTTDSTGRASVAATLPSTAGATMQVAASADALGESAVFTATTQDEFRVRIIKGDDQLVVPRRKAADSLIVEVTDELGRVVQGANITWSIVDLDQEDGSLLAKESVTDGEGLAMNVYRAGDTETSGPQKVKAEVFTGDSASFDLEISTPAQISVVAGDGQTGQAGSLLERRLEAEVLDAAGQPLPNAEVTWSTSTSAPSGTVGPSPDGPFSEVIRTRTDRNGVAAAWRQLPDYECSDGDDETTITCQVETTTTVELEEWLEVEPAHFSATAEKEEGNG